MKLPNGFGSVYKLSGNRRNPYVAKKTKGWEIDPITGKSIIYNRRILPDTQRGSHRISGI